MTGPYKDSEFFTFNNFSGGISDDVISGNPGRFTTFNNLVPLVQNNSASTRPGSQEFLTVPDGSKIDFMFEYGRQKAFLFGEGGSLYSVTVPDNPDSAPIIEKVNSITSSANNIYEGESISISKWGENVLISDGINRPRKVYLDTENSRWVWRDAGLPDIFPRRIIANNNNVNFNVSQAGNGAGEAKYLYYFVLYTTYTANRFKYEDFGGFTIFNADQFREINGTNKVTIKNFPALPLSWELDSNQVKLRIYRTINGGTTPYYVGQIDAPNSNRNTFEDSISDENLQNLSTSAPLYALPNVAPNQQPPIAKYTYVHRDTGFYAGVPSEGNNILYQSKIGDVDSVPRTFFESFDEEIIGLSSIQDKLLIFCKNKVYSMRGLLDDTGRTALSVPVEGVYDTVLLSNAAGCLSHNCIVPTDKSVFWLGDEGIYGTDGTLVQKIQSSIHLSDRLNEWKEAWNGNFSGIQGVYHKKDNRIFWIHRNKEYKFLLVLDLNFVNENRFPLYTWSGSPEQRNAADYFVPQCLLFHKDKLFRGEAKHPVILEHDEEIFGDFDYIRNVQRSVKIDLKTAAVNFGNSDLNKDLQQILFVIDREFSTALQPYVFRDRQGKEGPDNTVIELDGSKLQRIEANRELSFAPIPKDNEGTASFQFGDHSIVLRERKLVQRKLWVNVNHMKTLNFVQLRIVSDKMKLAEYGNHDEDGVDPKFKYRLTLTNIEPSLGLPANIYDGRNIGLAKYKARFTGGIDPTTGTKTPLENRLPRATLVGNALSYVQGDRTYEFPIQDAVYVNGARDTDPDEITLDVEIDFNDNPFGWTETTPANTFLENIPFDVTGYLFNDKVNLINFTFIYKTRGNFFRVKVVGES